MNTKIFEEMEQAAENSRTCAAALNLFTRELEEMDGLIRQRVQRQKEETGQRLASLRETVGKAGVSDTVRRMSEIEIRQLEAVSCAPTAEEVSTFAETKDRALDAARDYDSARERFRTLYDAALKELTATKEEVFPPKELVGQHRDSISRTEEKFYLFVNSFDV